MKVNRYLPDRNRSLLAWQRPALAWMLKQTNPALFMDMRLGKSLLTIEYCIRKGLQKVLVLCPKTAVVSWVEELRLEGLRTFKLDTPKQKTNAVTCTTKGWYLASLQTILNVPLNVGEWDCIVIDESSRMKNPRAIITNKLIRYFSTIPHKILLSGTPAPENIIETVPQLIFKDGNCLGCRTFWDFRSRYMRQLDFDWVLRPGVYERLKASLHQSAYFLSQQGADWDTHELREVVYFELNAEQRRLTLELLEHFEMTFKHKRYSTKFILPRTLWLQRIASGYVDGNLVNAEKVMWVVNRIKNNPGKKFIVWFRFNEEIEYVKKILTNVGVQSEALYGKCDLEKRIELQNSFQRGCIDALLIQTKLGQYALNLSRAWEAIYFSNSFSSEERVQSEKRICHTNRTMPPSYKDLVAKDSIEEEVLQMIKGKYVDLRALWNRVQISKEKL